MIRRLALTAFAAILGAKVAHANPEPVPVLATIGMIGDLATRVGGDCARVDVLIGPGNDPHLYQPRASDIARLQQAQVILHQGLNLEGRLGDVLQRLGRDRIVLAVGEQAVPQGLLIVEDAAPDPHLWMDVSLWARLVPVIAAGLERARPDCAADLAANAALLEADLAALHDWARDSLASIPESARVLVTAHDAFGYFARAYGLRALAIQGFSTEAEASVADIRDVAATVVEAGVPAVFVESTINPRTIAALREAVAARGAAVDLGGSLFSDAMGEAGTPEGTYIGMIRANVIAIATALGGQPAPWPETLQPWAKAQNVTP